MYAQSRQDVYFVCVIQRNGPGILCTITYCAIGITQYNKLLLVQLYIYIYIYIYIII